MIGVCDKIVCITGFQEIGSGENKWISRCNAVAQQGSPALDGWRKGFDVSSRAPRTKSSHPASSEKAGSLPRRDGEAFSPSLFFLSTFRQDNAPEGEGGIRSDTAPVGIGSEGFICVKIARTGRWGGSMLYCDLDHKSVGDFGPG